MLIDSYSEEGVWIKIPYYDILTDGPEEVYEELVKLTQNLDLVKQVDDEEENAKFALFR